ncbi:MAG TPA: HAD family hydrolase [bacterium]|nr:HAD family hydrolase [bacterium]
MEGAAYNAAVVTPARVALIFDMDNTLIGSRIDFPAIRRSLIAMLRTTGAVDESDEVLMRRALAQLVAIGAAHDRHHGTALARRMWEIIEAHEAEGLRDALPLDGAAEVLGTLRARGFRIAVLTNNGRTGAVDALHASGLGGLAETVIARDDAGALKPAGDGVWEAVRRLGSVERSYVIGDSWIDGAAAAEAGARFIAYRRSAEELGDRGIHPWCCVAHLGELLALDFTT